MRILVTGAGGMLGQDVVRAATEAGHVPIGLTRAELDVRDAAAVTERLGAERPHAVVNCAAFTNVDGAEDDLRSAAAVNANAAGHVAAAAARTDATVVYPSTDYVFDGLAGTPYVESSPTRPESVYGQTKLAGEHETAAANPRHQIVRTSWLFGIGGRNFVETMLTLAREHGEARVVADQVGRPTYTPHLATVLVALCEAENQGVWHVAGGGSETSWHDFAAEIFRQAEVDCHLSPCRTEDFPRPAPRPPHAVLDSERPDPPRLPPWQDGLAAYLTQRAAQHR